MNICDLDNCEVATVTVQEWHNGTISASTTAEGDLDGMTFILTKGNGAQIIQEGSGGSTSVTIDMTDTSLAYWLEADGNPYIITVVNLSGETQNIFTNADGEPTSCITFNVRPVWNAPYDIVLNP